MKTKNDDFRSLKKVKSEVLTNKKAVRNILAAFLSLRDGVSLHKFYSCLLAIVRSGYSYINSGIKIFDI